VLGHIRYTKPYHSEEGTKPCWQTHVSLQILTQIGGKNKADRENIEKGGQIPGK